MRSRSNSLEDVAQAKMAQQHHVDSHKRSTEREDPSGRAERRSRHRETPDDTDTIQRNHKLTKNGTCAGGSGSTSGSNAAKGVRREKSRDLSRDDLVFLLSLLEGELQVIETVNVTSQIGSQPLKQSAEPCRHGTDPSRTCWLRGKWALKASVNRQLPVIPAPDPGIHWHRCWM